MLQVLYVEDDPLIQAEGEACLRDAGYQVTVASDGPEGCAMLHRHAEGLDALVTDVDLPGGVNGWEIAALGRLLIAKLPVVYVTGAGAAAYRLHGVPDSILCQKPCGWSLVLRSVSSLLPAA